MSEETKILSLDDILTAKDLEERVLEIPEWGGAVKVRGLARAEVTEVYNLSTDRKSGQIDPRLVDQWLVVHGLVEPHVDQFAYKRLVDKSAAAVQRVIGAIMALSGLTATAMAEAEADFRR